MVTWVMLAARLAPLGPGSTQPGYSVSKVAGSDTPPSRMPMSDARYWACDWKVLNPAGAVTDVAMIPVLASVTASVTQRQLCAGSGVGNSNSTPMAAVRIATTLRIGVNLPIRENQFSDRWCR